MNAAIKELKEYAEEKSEIMAESININIKIRRTKENENS